MLFKVNFKKMFSFQNSFKKKKKNLVPMNDYTFKLKVLEGITKSIVLFLLQLKSKFSNCFFFLILIAVVDSQYNLIQRICVCVCNSFCDVFVRNLNVVFIYLNSMPQVYNIV